MPTLVRLLQKAQKAKDKSLALAIEIRKRREWG
jgi:hypothetical protein